MIKVTAIEVESVFYPSEIPSTEFGSHFDGVEFYFFESENERNEFYLSLRLTNK